MVLDLPRKGSIVWLSPDFQAIINALQTISVLYIQSYMRTTNLLRVSTTQI